VGTVPADRVDLAAIAEAALRQPVASRDESLRHMGVLARHLLDAAAS
jgi:hypothetical protein